MNGYELCEMLLKSNELVDFSLTGLVLQEVVVDVEQNLVKISLEKDGDGFSLVDSFEAFHANEQKEKRAYWAMRSMSSAVVLPLALDDMLKLLYKKGYEYLVFSDSNGNIELSLRDIRMDIWSMKPTVRVETNLSPVSESCVHITNVVDGYVIDLTAGVFWLFDRQERPMILTPRKNYLALVGEKGGKIKDIDQVLEEETKKGPIKSHSAGLLKLVMERKNFSWEENMPPLLKGVRPFTQQEKLRTLKDFGNETLKEMFGVYLNEADTPITRLLRELHTEMLKEESSLMTDI